jgi:hypothetical protein
MSRLLRTSLGVTLGLALLLCAVAVWLRQDRIASEDQVFASVLEMGGVLVPSGEECRAENNLFLAGADVPASICTGIMTLPLCELDLEGCRLGHVSALVPNTDIHALLLRRVDANSTTIQRIVEACPNLTRLDLGHTGCGDSLTVAIARLPQVIELHIEDTGMSEGAVLEVIKGKQLKSLTVGPATSAECVRTICSEGVAIELRLWRSALSDNDLDWMRRHHPLQQFVLVERRVMASPPDG